MDNRYNAQSDIMTKYTSIQTISSVENKTVYAHLTFYF